MKNIMKKVAMLLMVSVLSMSFVACGEKPADTQESEQGSKESKEDKVSPDESKPEGEDSNQGNEPDEEKPLVYPIEIYIQSVYDGEWDEVYLASMQYEKVYVGEGSAAAFPNLEEALNNRNWALSQNQEALYEQNLVQARVDYTENREIFFGPYETKEEINVLRADSRVVSLGCDSYEYGGGVHGYNAYFAENFDSQTGKALKLGDVITAPEKLPDIIYNKLMEENEPEDFWDNLKEYLTDSFKLVDNDAPICWGIDNTGIMFYFNPYEIASYAAGIFTVGIGFDEYPEIFNPYYTEVSDAYVVTSGRYDLNNDGKMDYYWAEAYQDEYDNIEEVTIFLNDNCVTEELWCYDYDTYLVHTKSGKNYLYLKTFHESDWSQITVFDMNGSAPKKVGTMGNVDFRWICIDAINYEYAKVAFTDPTEFVLESQMDVASTYSAEKTYHVGEDGMPVSDDWRYHTSFSGIEGIEELATKTSVTGVLLDEYGKSTGEKYVIPAGTKLEIVGTDGDSFIDVWTGQYTVELNVDCSDWPQTIDGVDIQELFSGVMFAG